MEDWRKEYYPKIITELSIIIEKQKKEIKELKAELKEKENISSKYYRVYWKVKNTTKDLKDNYREFIDLDAAKEFRESLYKSGVFINNEILVYIQSY